MFSQHASTFFAASQAHLANGKNLFNLQRARLVEPYYSGHLHARSLSYPLVHAGRAVCNAALVLKGTLLLVGALVNEPTTNLPMVAGAMVREAVAFALNLVNAAVSILSFATRTIATVFNLSYKSTSIENAIEHAAERAINQSTNGDGYISGCAAVGDALRTNARSEELELDYATFKL